VTVSPVQARWAARHIRESGLSDRVACVEGDYSDLPPGLGQADLAYAIESFVHAPAPDRFFAQCARLLRADGMLVICDDILRAPAGSADLRTVERFMRGWRVNALLRRGELQALARSAGFEHEFTDDLTPHLETHRVRDRAIAALVASFGWLLSDQSRFGHLAGGSALQTCLARGWIGYELAVFRRR
jgi:cyclopropane fatty-acyl-phospholipid synthase-like methyltransferase